MRRRFVRKKRIFLLSCVPFLFLGGVTAFDLFEREQGLFLQRKHSLIEERVSHATGLKVQLGKLKIGILQDTVLEDLALTLPGEGFTATFPRARFRKGNGVTKIGFEEGRVSWKGMVFSQLEGRLALSAQPLGSPVMPQKGVLEGVFQGRGRLKITLQKRNPLVLKGEILLQNFEWRERRISGLGEVLIFFRDNRQPWKDFKVKITWHRFFLEEELLEDVRGSFSFTENSLLIERLEWGKALLFSGKILLGSPYLTEGKLHFEESRRERMKYFLKDLSPEGIPRRVEGTLFLKGPLRKMRLSGKIVAQDARIKGTDYQKVVSTFQGQWPVAAVESRLEHEFPKESTVVLLGWADLSRLGQKGFFKTTSIEGRGGMFWKGMTFGAPSNETLVVGKDSRTTSVSLRTFLNPTFPEEQEEEEFEFEYRLRKDKSFKMRLKGEEEFLGIERRLNF